MSEQQHADNLNASRAASLKNPTQQLKKQIPGPLESFTLLKYLDPFMDWLFGIALIFAVLKDIFDIINNALVAAGGVGWLLIIIFTTFCSLIIFFIMLITGASGKTKIARNIAKRIALLIATTLAEYLPAIDLLPLETLVVIIIFYMTLKERKNSAQEEKLQNAQYA